MSHAGARPLLLEIGPLPAFLFAIWAKLCTFNLPYKMDLAHDWYPWTTGEAVLAALGSLATLLVLGAPLLLLSPLQRFIVLWILDLVVSIVVLADLLHFRYFGDVVSVTGLSVVWQVALVSRSVIALLQPSDLLFFVDLIVALAVLGPYRRFLQTAPRIGRPPLRMVAAGMLAAGLLLLAVPVRAVVIDKDDLFFYDFFRFLGVRKIGLLNYHLYEIGRHLSRVMLGRRHISPEERARALAFVERRRAVAMVPSELFGVARGRNLIIVMVESLHAFPIGLGIHDHEITPNLNAFARRSIVFENFYRQTWNGQTSDGEFTSLQSLHPLPTGAVATTYPMHHYRGLPRILRERGYTTLSAHAYYGDLWKMREVHPRIGFQQSFFRESYRLTEEIGLGLSDAAFFEQTVALLERQPRPFMAFLMTLTTHHPYKMPEAYRGLNVGDLEDTMVGNYLEAVHYFDTAFGRLVELLEKDDLLDESVLVLYGDHPGNFGGSSDLTNLLAEDAGVQAPSAGFNYRTWEAENRLPLIIHLPHDAAAGVRSVSGGHLDIAPTLLNLLGIEGHGMVMLGRDLTTGENSLVVLRNGSFIEGRTLCLTPHASSTSAECRDLETGEILDPARLRARFEEARAQLEISDLIIEGDLIPRD